MGSGATLAYTALILLASAGLCLAAWRIASSLKLIPARSFVFPLAVALALIATSWFTWVSLVETLSIDSATEWVAVFMLLFPVPVLALVVAALLTGPIVLGCNLTPVSRSLNTTRPSALANVLASACVILLIAGAVVFALPYYQALELGRQARAPETHPEVLIELAKQAALEKDPGLAHHLLQNPAVTDEILDILIAGCTASPATEGCQDYMRLLQRHPNAPRQSAAQ